MSTVLSYLRYLDTMSRKIGSHTGMTRVFSDKKTAGINQHYYDYDTLLYNHEQEQKRFRLYLRTMHDTIMQEENRRLFLGIGCIAGQIQKRDNRRSRIVAPLLFVPVTLEYETSDISCDILWEDIQLNYDCIASILQVDHAEDQDSISSQTDPEVLLALTDIEQNLLTGDEGTFLDKTFADTVLSTLQQAIRQLGDIAVSNTPFAINDLRSYSEQKATFFNSRFLFQAHAPSEISISHGIRDIISQIEEEGECRNSLLRKLLEGVLEDHRIEVRRDMMHEGEVEKALTLLPVSLSEPQKQGIRNAWMSEISYIQGPPGTGKSHTITALMLSAILLGKKVLLVSQKKAAIDIVRSKLTGRTNTNTYIADNAVLFTGALSEDRRALKSYIQACIQSVKGTTAPISDAGNNDQLQESGHLADRVQMLTDDLREETELHHKFYTSTLRFSTLYNSFRATYPDSSIHNLTDLLHDLSHLTSHLQEIDRRFRTKGQLLKKEVIALKISLRRLLHALGAGADEKMIFQWLAMRQFSSLAQYFSRLHEVTLLRSRILAQQRSLRTPDELRRELEEQQASLKQTSLEHLRTSHGHHLRNTMRQSRNDADLFARMLHFRKPSRIKKLMHSIDYRNFTDSFRLWAGEIRDLGDYLAFTPELFDLVVVDEASQVNIAEFLPAFYRGCRICIVGDEHQLGLQASGMFVLNKNFEKMIWNRHFPLLPYEVAKEKNILVSESSILDFIISDNAFAVPKVMLNEHFRSMPQLARFTSRTFYDGELRIMTEIGNNPLRSCFSAIKVEGRRRNGEKVIPEEVDAAMSIVQGIIRQAIYHTDPLLSLHTFPDNIPSLGIVAFTSDQVEEFRERLRDEFHEKELVRHKIFAGTPEEFQGNERNIIILTPAVDKLHSGAAFYGNARRFNVATSRATHFTYFIHTALSSQLMHDYLAYIQSTSKSDKHAAFFSEWTFSPDRYSTEFDRLIGSFLGDYTKRHPAGELLLYNGIESCGWQLDFAILNTSTGKCVAVGTEGKPFLTTLEGSYADAHLGQTEILQRAGWQLVYIPYFRWYHDGKLRRESDAPVVAAEVQKLYRDLDTLLR